MLLGVKSQIVTNSQKITSQTSLKQLPEVVSLQVVTLVQYSSLHSINYAPRRKALNSHKLAKNNFENKLKTTSEVVSLQVVTLVLCFSSHSINYAPWRTMPNSHFLAKICIVQVVTPYLLYNRWRNANRQVKNG